MWIGILYRCDIIVDGASPHEIGTNQRLGCGVRPNTSLFVICLDISIRMIISYLIHIPNLMPK